MSTTINADNYSLRELMRMGYFNSSRPSNVQARRSTLTDSGRVSKPPRRYTEIKFIRGSGVARRVSHDSTDMSF